MLKRRLAPHQDAPPGEHPIALLATIARHHGVAFDAARLGPVTSEPTLPQLQAVAERLGWACRIVHVSHEALDMVPLPAIVRCSPADGESRYGVLQAIDERHAVIADPTGAVIRLTREQLAARGTGQMMVVQPVGHPGPATPLELVAPRRPIVLAAVAYTCFATMMACMIGYGLARGVARFGASAPVVALAAIAIAAVHTCLGRVRRRFAASIRGSIRHELHRDYVGHVLRWPLRVADVKRVVTAIAGAESARKLPDRLANVALVAIADAMVVASAFAAIAVIATVPPDGGALASILLYAGSLLLCATAPLWRLLQLPTQLRTVSDEVVALYDRLDAALEHDDSAPGLQLERIREAIEMRGVSYHVGGNHKLLDRVDLTLLAGRMVALLGHRGSGKTTLLQLLLRIQEPTEGRIVYDGIDVREFDMQPLHVGWLSSQPALVPGTIHDNIALGRPDASTDEVAEAALRAGLDPLISKLPLRFRTVIGEGGMTLPLAQAQRIAIARVLLRRPQLVVLDEATSALEPYEERTLLEQVREALVGHTVVVASSRISGVRVADTIHVLAGGRIVETGGHHQLIRAGGAYTALARADRRTSSVGFAALVHMAAREPATYGALLAKGVARAR